MCVIDNNQYLEVKKLLLQEMTREMLNEAGRNKELLKVVIRGIAQNKEAIRAVMRDIIALREE